MQMHRAMQKFRRARRGLESREEGRNAVYVQASGKRAEFLFSIGETVYSD